MSYTEITFFAKNGKPKFDVDIRNAWRGAMAIWNILEDRYLPPFIPEWAKHMGMVKDRHYRMSSSEMADKRAVWDIWKLPQCSDTDRIVMGSTFDWVVVMRDDVPKLIKAFAEFNGETSLPEQADAIEDAFKDKSIIAVAWNQTSVSENQWRTFEYDQKRDKAIPYNLKKHTKHWSLFPSILQPTAIPQP